jgi:predicted nucleic acid-binding Zn ribbon protein
MFCPNCGNKIPDDSAFCGVCGSPIEPEKTPGNKGALKIILIFALVIAIAGGAVLGVFKSGIIKKNSKSNAPNYCVWVSDDTYNFTKDYRKKDVKSIKIGSLKQNYSKELSQYKIVSMTKDGKYLYYFNRLENNGSRGVLYRAELGKLKDGSNKNDNYIIKIDSDVYTGITVRDDNTILYSKPDSDASYSKIYYFDGKESVVLAKGVLDSNVVNDYLYYTKTKDGGDSFALYCQTIGKTDSEVKIASDVAEGNFYCVGDENVAYTKEVNDDLSTTLALYIGGISTDSQKLCDNFYDSYWTCTLQNVNSISNKAFFYLTEKTTEVNLAEYVDNPHAASDAGMVEPSYSDSKYQKSVQKTDWWGDTYTTTETDYDAYQADYEKYSEAQERIELMEYLENNTITDSSYSLYFYDIAVGEPVLVAEQIDTSLIYPSLGFSHSTAGAVYLKKDDKIEKISIDTIISEDFDSYYLSGAASRVETYYYEHAVNTDTIYMTMVGGTEQEVSAEKFNFDDQSEAIDFVLYNNGKNVAIMSHDYEDYASDIFVASVTNKTIGEFSSISSKDAIYIYSKNDKLMYVNGSDVYLYNNGKHICLLQDVDASYYYDDNISWYTDGTGLANVDYDSTYGGTLYSLTEEGKSTKIADDVREYRALDNGKVMYLTDDNLKLYDGKNSKTIAQSVDMFWTLHEREPAQSYTYFYDK